MFAEGAEFRGVDDTLSALGAGNFLVSHYRDDDDADNPENPEADHSGESDHDANRGGVVTFFLGDIPREETAGDCNCKIEDRTEDCGLSWVGFHPKPEEKSGTNKENGDQDRLSSCGLWSADLHG